MSLRINGRHRAGDAVVGPGPLLCAKPPQFGAVIQPEAIDPPLGRLAIVVIPVNAAIENRRRRVAVAEFAASQDLGAARGPFPQQAGFGRNRIAIGSPELGPVAGHDRGCTPHDNGKGREKPPEIAHRAGSSQIERNFQTGGAAKHPRQTSLIMTYCRW